MPRLKTIKAFDEWKLVPENVDELFRLIVEDRMRLRDAAIEGVKQPYTLVYAFLHDGGEMQKRYEAALAAVADDIAHEALEIADEQGEVVREDGSKFDPDVPRDKLRVDTRFQLAKKWGPGRYRDKEAERGGGIQVYVDRSCGGSVQISAGGSSARIALGEKEALAVPAEKPLENQEG